jgi:translation initiation factor 2 subunit 1
MDDIPQDLHENSREGTKKSFRFYEQQYPEVDDLVMVKVTSIADMGAYVSLLEYGNIEGMILLSELSRRRIRSINKLIRVGRNEVCVVLRVDKEKGYIDLSKRRVNPEDIQECETKYNKSKAVASIMRHLSELTGENIEELYKSIGWPLYRKFGHAFDAFKLCLTEPEKVLSEVTFKNENIKKQFLQIIERRLKPQPVKIRTDIEVTCFATEGIDAIKGGLKAGEKMGTEQTPIKIQLVAPPLYVMTCTALDKKMGIELLQKATEEVNNYVKSKGGEVVIKAAPRAVTARDDHSLSVLLEQLRDQNKEVDGDADSDEEF